MKNILFLAVLLSTYIVGNSQTRHDFSINILDNLFMEYRINKDSLTVIKVIGRRPEQHLTIIRKKLSVWDSQRFSRFLDTIPWDSLKTEYEDKGIVNILDGDQKKISLVWNNNIRTISLNNGYQKDMDHLFNLVNQFISQKRFKIKYYVVNH